MNDLASSPDDSICKVFWTSPSQYPFALHPLPCQLQYPYSVHLSLQPIFSIYAAPLEQERAGLQRTPYQSKSQDERLLRVWDIILVNFLISESDRLTALHYGTRLGWV